MNRAAIIVTDAERVRVPHYGRGALYVPASEQLLADLRVLVKLPGPSQMGWVEAQQAAARVRALLPEEDDDE